MPSENLAAARVHLQALVNTYRENFLLAARLF